MTRQQALRAILDFVGPLGPFQDPDERDRREEAWAADTDDAAVEQILDLVRRPPSGDELGRIAPEGLAYELSRILTMIGARAPSALLAKVGPLLDDPRARSTMIEVIGSLGVEDGLSWLDPLIDDRTLTGDEAAGLACALGEIGGPRALGLLDRLAVATPPERHQVHDEIDVARQAARD